MNTYLQRPRRGTVAPSVVFDDIGRDSSANRRSNLARVPGDHVYFRDLRKLVSKAFPFKKKQSQNIQQSQISPTASAQGTSRRSPRSPHSPPYYTSADNNTYFKNVSRRDPVMSRGRLEAAQKYRSKQTISVLSNDMFRKILKHTIAHDKTVLDVRLLKSYIKERRKSSALSRINNDEYASFLNNILTVHLENVEITDAILEILKKTIEHSNISTIILRKITFSNEERICEKFLEYLSKNTKLCILILDDVGIDRDNFNNFLRILESFKELDLLEFSNFNITRLFKVYNDVQFHYFFMKVIINLDTLNYLIFNNNTISQMDYTYLFNKLNGANNYYVIDLGRDGIYLKYNDNKDEEDDNKVKLEEHFMHIIEIDTAGRKTLNRCVDRYYIEFHTNGNKYAFNKSLTSFRHKYIGQDAKYLFEKYNVPLYLLPTL
jgi:hypothetical protein